MTVKELMERVGDNRTGLMVAYIKDALEEMNIVSETHITTSRIDITKDQRYYTLPKDCIKITDIRCKNHNNSKDQYGGIPRMIGEPLIEDEDQELI
tara:strand:- start:225 stop:512 length:288 start_codon:yes stop_codon:yes gene_type:complete